MTEPPPRHPTYPTRAVSECRVMKWKISHSSNELALNLLYRLVSSYPFRGCQLGGRYLACISLACPGKRGQTGPNGRFPPEVPRQSPPTLQQQELRASRGSHARTLEACDDCHCSTATKHIVPCWLGKWCRVAKRVRYTGFAFHCEVYEKTRCYAAVNRFVAEIIPWSLILLIGLGTQTRGHYYQITPIWPLERDRLYYSGIRTYNGDVLK